MIGWRSAIAAATLLLATGPAIAAPAAGSSVEIRAASGGNVNVRRTPEVAPANVVGRAPAGTPATVTESATRGAHTWYRLRIDTLGLEGWVRGDLVVETAAPAPADDGGATLAAVPGAARPPDAAAPPSPGSNDWTRYIPALLPAIDSCLDFVTVKPAVVTRVYELERGMAGVRLRDRPGRRWECLIARAGGTPFRQEPLADRVRPLPGDGDPIFTRAPGEPPDDPCWRNEEMVDPASGTLLGWRSYKIC
jgi:hypothetical protein